MVDGWPECINITIDGDPISKGRPRVYHGHGVTPEQTRRAEKRVSDEFRRQYPFWQPYPGPIRISLTFWLANRRGRDWDNLAKLTTDALNGIAWVDDRQIIHADVHKIQPDLWVIGKRGIRKRKPDDPLTGYGYTYTPHTDLTIALEQEYKPTGTTEEAVA